MSVIVITIRASNEERPSLAGLVGIGMTDPLFLSNNAVEKQKSYEEECGWSCSKSCHIR